MKPVNPFEIQTSNGRVCNMAWNMGWDACWKWLNELCTEHDCTLFERKYCSECMREYKE